MKTKEEIKNSVVDFISTIKKEPCCKYFLPDETGTVEKVIWGDEKIYKDALYQGYLDACRTIHWSTKASFPKGKDLLKRKEDWDRNKSVEKENPMREPLTGVAEELKEYFKADKKFDDQYYHWCREIIHSYEDYLEGGITYGQAQKIINMAFKYLYCICDQCEEGEVYKKKFKACHMPLDSYSLEWFKRKFKKDDFLISESYSKNSKKLQENLFTKDKNLKAESIGSWSSMKSWNDSGNQIANVYSGKTYPYEFYQTVIKKYCEEYSKEKNWEEQITPLQLDFIVWPKMQKIMAAEAFIKAFEEDDDNWVQKAMEKETYNINELDEILKKRLIKIRPLVCDGTDSQICKKK